MKRTVTFTAQNFHLRKTKRKHIYCYSLNLLCFHKEVSVELSEILIANILKLNPTQIIKGFFYAYWSIVSLAYIGITLLESTERKMVSFCVSQLMHLNMHKTR